jgi:hypothetical protein
VTEFSRLQGRHVPLAWLQFSRLQGRHVPRAWLLFLRLLARHGLRAGLLFSRLQVRHGSRAVLQFSRLLARHAPRGSRAALPLPSAQAFRRAWSAPSSLRLELSFLLQPALRQQHSPGVRRWPWHTKFYRPWLYPRVASESLSEAYAARATLLALKA